MRYWLLLLMAVGVAHGAAFTQAYSFVAGGSSSCFVFGPTAEMRASGISGGVATPGPGCGVTESLDNQLGAGAAVVAASSLNVSGTSTFGAYNINGSAQATAGPTSLGTLASITVSGAVDGGTARGAEAFAVMSESIAPLTGTVVGGTVRYTLGLHGLQTFGTPGPGGSSGDGVFGVYYLQPGATIASSVFYGAAGHSGVYTLFGGQYQYSSGNGVTITPTSVAVNKTIQFEMPYDSTTTYMSRLILYSGLFAGTNVVLNSDWINTVTIQNVEVFDAQGGAVAIVRGSQDTSTVPEPEAGWLVAVGLVILLTVKMKQRTLIGDSGDSTVVAAERRGPGGDGRADAAGL